MSSIQSVLLVAEITLSKLIETKTITSGSSFILVQETSASKSQNFTKSSLSNLLWVFPKMNIELDLKKLRGLKKAKVSKSLSKLFEKKQ
jgi:hypothetical protein